MSSAHRAPAAVSAPEAGVVAPRRLHERVVWRIRRVLHPLVEIAPPPDDVIAEWNVPVVMRDGVTLRINVFRPDTDAPVPVIMSAHPYGKDRIPANGRGGRAVNPQYRVMPQPRPVRISAWTGWEAPDPAVWTRRGYAVVNADMRGGGSSEGTGHLLSDEEARDYAELIEWAGTQPWSNGKVGLDGVSYLALSQYRVAALAPPHLAAICPWEGFTDLYRDFVYPGGVRERGFSIMWSTLTRRAARVAPNLRAALAAHPTRDAFFEERTPPIENIRVPMLVCGSFSDHNLHTRGSFEAFRRVGSREKWLYTHRDGKWAHYYSDEATETRARFFDHYLRGVDNGWAETPRVRVAIHERGADPVAVAHEQTWPPDDLTWTKLRLDAGLGRLVDDAPQPATASFALRDKRGTAFEWTVPEDVDVLGTMALRLHVELHDTDDANLFAVVHKYHEGRRDAFEGSFGFNIDAVTTGWQRIAFRELDDVLSTEAQPVHTFRTLHRVRPGEIVPVHVALGEHATRFRAGDVLRLELRGRWHFARNPFTGQIPSGYRASRGGTCVLHTGGEHDSWLLLGHRAPTR